MSNVGEQQAYVVAGKREREGIRTTLVFGSVVEIGP
jgi:hypothetical protein